MAEKFGWCFIGCGTLGVKVAKAITASGRHRIVSVYCRTPERAEEFAKTWGGAAFPDAESAMRAPGVEGVYVVTPHNSHYEYSKLALELGLPVLCEKPLTVSAREARELIELAREKKLYFAEAMWTWFAPAANAIKGWLDSGEFGEVESVTLYCRTMGRYYAPRVTDANTAGGALLDMGVYAITYLYRLFGKPVNVLCSGRVEEGIDWEEDVTLTFPSGLTVTTSVAITDFKGLERFELRGSRGRVRLRMFHRAGSATLWRSDGSFKRVIGKCTYLNEFDIVSREIREGLTESRYAPLSATLAVMEIMDKCREDLGLVYPFEK